MSSENHKQFSFGDFVVDCENFRVLKGGKILTLTPRAFDVLIYLIRHSERVVEKKELFDQVWRDTIVTDNALTKVVKELRHVLADDVNEPKYIETVPKRGYHFIAPVTESEVASVSGVNNAHLPQSTSSRFVTSSRVLGLFIVGLVLVLVVTAWLVSRRRNPQVSSSPIRSIAVLPFRPLNAESRDESLEMGMTETLITRLSSLKQVVVRPMSAVRKYTDPQQDSVKAGQDIQVEAVVDGSIQKAGERVRVTTRLIDVRDGMTIWSEQFDENFTDIFKVQDSISQKIADALTIHLSRQEQAQLVKRYTNSPEAYQLYLQGNLIWHSRRQNWFEQSMVYYQRALEKDPNFALAHVAIADCYISLSGNRKISAQEAELKARPAIMKALEIDNELALAHNALAELKYQYEFDWNTAEKEFKRALELNPNVAWIHQAYGWFLMSEGRFAEAAVEMDKSRELDPSSIATSSARGRLYYYSRQYDQALRHFQNILAVEPDNSVIYSLLFATYAQKEMYAEAVETFLKMGSIHGAPAEQIERVREVFRTSGWRGFNLRRLQIMKDAAKTEYVEPGQLAYLYTRLGMKDEALTELERAVADRDIFILQLKIDPAFDSLRDDPRYAQLLRRIGLEP
jgi:DNA-binding winged helix-turn-helix (wHTH) protein/TolB-like protein/Tfp pilus assembly protein PilF